MVMLPVDTMYLTLLVLFMLPRERLRLNQRPMLMLSTAPMDMVLDPSMEDTPPTPDQLSPAMLLLLSLPLLTPDPLDTLPTLDQSMEDTQATMAREMLRLNQRPMLMLSTVLMDMVLDTLPTPDLSMEDTPPTLDQLSLAMPDQLFPPLDTLPTLDQSTEDTPATMERERLRLNPRLMLMLSTALMDMVLDIPPTPDLSMEDTLPTPDQLSPATPDQLFPPLDTLPTPDLSMEDTLPTPDQLSPAMPDQLFPPLDTLPTPDQSMEDTPATMERETLRLNPRLMLMLFIAPMDMVLVLDLSMEDTPPTPDQLSPAMPDQLFPPLDTPPTP